MYKLRSEHIGRRLFIAMSVIVLSLLLISVPLIVNSYQSYQKSKRALIEIQNLKMVTALANSISRERAPANYAMASDVPELPSRLQELQRHRQSVDDQLARSVVVLKQSGFINVAQQLEKRVKPSLDKARKGVDDYHRLPLQQRSSQQLDHAILGMFSAWDICEQSVRQVILESNNKESSISNYYVLILVLADLRDQAGRVASNVMAAVTFNEPIPYENLARSLQTQYQAQYLWSVISTIQPEQDKTGEFIYLNQRVKSEFIDRGIPIIKKLLDESLAHQPYSMTSSQLTDALVDKYTTVVDLQNYMLDYSLQIANQERSEAYKKLILTLVISGISLFSALFTLIYARKHLFTPLIQARSLLLEISKNQKDSDDIPNFSNQDSLFGAIQRLQMMLQQRDALEFRLKHIANSDSLTGVSNRFALEEYIKFREQQSSRFKETCLIVVDIDSFKQVNDRYGHITGDLVIQYIVDKLKENIRSSDLIVRYGGDEFIIVLEHIHMEQAQRVAEKIRSDVFHGEIDAGVQGKLKASVSIGIAVGANSWIELLKRADQALFRAKAAGRNAVSS